MKTNKVTQSNRATDGPGCITASNSHRTNTVTHLSTSEQPVSHEAIACRAQELWVAHGRPENRDQEIWLEAEGELAATQQKTPGTTSI